jgi:hypothetical protein
VHPRAKVEVPPLFPHANDPLFPAPPAPTVIDIDSPGVTEILFP